MMRRLDCLLEIIDGVVPTLLFLVATALVATDIFLRNIVRTTIPHGIEIATYAFIWFIFLSAAGASRKGEHFQVGFLENMLGDRARRLSGAAVELVGLVVAVIMADAAWEYMDRSWRRVSEGMQIPLAYVYMVFPVCFGLMALAHLRRLWQALRGADGAG